MYLVIDLEPTRSMPPSSRALIFVAWVRHRQVARAAARPMRRYWPYVPHARYAVVRPYIADIAICV